MGQLISNRIGAIVVFGLTCAFPVFGQSMSDSLADQVEETVESALEDNTRDREDSQFAEMLLQLSMNPMDLRSATVADLQQIPGIDPLLASRIVAYRREHGFRSVDDLIQIEGLDRSLFQQVRGFLKVSSGSGRKNLTDKTTIHYTERTIRRLQDQRGYIDGSFLGNPLKIYNKCSGRFPVNSGFLIEAGWLTEKDPGEKNIAEFATGFVGFSNASKSVRCIIGDYAVEAGQGLALWRASGATKGNEVISNVTKGARGLQPYASSDENGYLRGIAVQVSLDGIGVTGFMSRKSINARINEGGFITSLDETGLSRTSSELQTKASSGETTLGVNVDTRPFNGFRMGVRTYSTRYDHLVALSGINGFEGQRASVQSIDFSFATGAIGSFAELAIDRLKSTAVVGGVILEPLSALSIGIAVRSYPQRFISMRGFGFGESGGPPQNEKGVYTSARLSLFEWLTVSSYYDQFATVGPSSVSLLPTEGHEFLSVVQLRGGDQSLLQIQVKQKNRAAEEMILDAFARSNPVVGRKAQSNYRVSFEWIASSAIRWRTRFERVRVDYSLSGSTATGLLVYQDVRWRLKKHLSIDGRVVVFETDSYDSRIYEYESELRGTFANPALFGKGIRLYVLARYTAGFLEVSLKYATTLKPGITSVGSGPTEIQGDTDNQLGLQIDVTL
jgi:hypothetical protein